MAISTPVPWKHIMTVFGSVLARLGKLEEGTPQSIPSSDALPPPCVHDASSLPRPSFLSKAILRSVLMIRLLFLPEHRCSSVRVNTFAENALRV